MKKTALHDLHKKLGAKMGEFAGYDMPLYYDLGVMKEHLWTRESCGLFDVSHMGQALMTGSEGGREALDFVQHITPSSFEKLPINKTKYTVLTNEEGGIIDDLMITRTDENEFNFVLNAGCKDKDIAWIKQHMPESCKFQYHDDWALLALQGPKSEIVVREVMDLDLSDLPYMGLWYKEGDYSMFISRLGYTGEDGFEISVPNDKAAALAEKLLAHEAVKPIGLAARDSLRVEMGYALYGHDIDATTSPVEADMSWVIGKKRDGYIGSKRIREELEQGTSRKLVGLKLIDKGIAREGAEIYSKDGKKIGDLTSGGHSPSLGCAIGQGYIDTSHAADGTEVDIDVRGRKIAAVITPRPFMKASTKSARNAA
ncbi:MAG: glycine cleavage system aminomethyltransferase GcvT [Micavibrio sp.]|nr:glycine cleavage system aminomethyltransferase GcvT [Micavibrio sp.]